MRATFFFGVALLCLCPPAFAQGSLFFTPPELQYIEREVQKNPPDAAAQAKHLLHLGSILYFGPTRWSLWLQGTKWTQETAPTGDIEILSVTPTEVRLNALLRNGSQLKNVRLRPHQSLNLLTGKIIEGL
ncbi:MAG: hypothetical protein AB7E52_07435 [Bdellovibrionales bacterium]